MFTELKESARNFPPSPGVYLMRNEKDTILYIGKAKDLRKRVLSYFTSGKDLKTQVLVKKIFRIEYIVTGNNYEALILENNLIKKWSPRYNINLKDGKSYPVIRITYEDFPRVFKTRRIIQDGSEYFGPFADVGKLDQFLELIEKLFPLRKCRGPLRKRYAPCLYYHIGRCSAPCAGKITKEEYQLVVAKVRKMLTGDTGEVEARLRREMKAASESLQFERAAEVRDTLTALESVHTNQQVEDFNWEKRDYAACAMREHLCTISVFQMREGKLIGRELFRAETFGNETDVLADFALQYYRETEDVPDFLYVSHDADTELLQGYFDKELAANMQAVKPEEGKHYRILKMALENAVMDVDKRLKNRENLTGLEALKEELDLKRLPRRIEGFDIAQLAGKYPVASLISFHNGVPDKKNYRRFHIKTLEGRIDDYEAIREAVARRYTRIVNEGLEEPDMILIDGGKGQVTAAREILDSLGLSSIPVFGLAKEFEEIHFADRDTPLRLPAGSEGLKVLQGVRDETHRFATAFNRQLRDKDTGFSLLESIAGIGEVRSRKLMQSFGSLEAIAAATPKEISEKSGLSDKTAKLLLKQLGL
ncbi:MAG: excinuclease ABC subunit UvrC [Spirochaetia bacterium]|nr:excinuclease ABC subunit UvrC [Spirochaetia bacterium]